MAAVCGHAIDYTPDTHTTLGVVRRAPGPTRADRKGSVSVPTRPDHSFIASFPPFAPNGRLRLLGLVMMLVALLVGSVIPVAAQSEDGAGAAIPGPSSSCEIPRATIDLTTTGTMTPLPPATPPATRAANGSATPPGTPAPPAVPPLTAELLTAATTITNCLNERDVETFTAITSDVYRGQQFGTGEPISAALYAELAPILLPLEYRILELRDITVVDPETVTAEVTYTAAYQRRSSIWTFIQNQVDGQLSWLLASEEAADPRIPDEASALDITIENDAYAVAGEAAVGPDVVIDLTNLDEEDHEALVLSLSEDTGTDALLRNPGPGLPEGVTFVGQSTVAAGEESTLVLADLPPGAYTIVCLLPDENGLPHLRSGMETTFTVT